MHDRFMPSRFMSSTETEIDRAKNTSRLHKRDSRNMLRCLTPFACDRILAERLRTGRAIADEVRLRRTSRYVRLIQFTFPTMPLALAVSTTRRTRCGPAERAMPICDSVIQFCHPPVSGMGSASVTFTPSIST